MLDLGPRVNTTEVINILNARPNHKVVVIDFDVLLLQTVLGAIYSPDRLELIKGDFASPTIMGGRQAVEMFSIYPDRNAAAALPSAVNFHLASGGIFYMVTEQQTRFNQVADALSTMIGFGYVHQQGVPTVNIAAGINGPMIGFPSEYSIVSTVYDLWGRKR